MKKKLLLVLGIVFTVLFAAALALNMYMSGSSDLLGTTGITTGQQNNKIVYDGTNNVLYLGTRTGSLYAIDNATHETKWEFKNEAASPITSIKFNSDSNTVYAGSDDTNVYVIDGATGSVKNTLEVRRRVVDLAVSSDEKLLAVTTKTNNKSNVLVYDINDMSEPLHNTSFTYEMKYLAFTSDDQNLLLTNSRAHFIRTDFDCNEVAIEESSVTGNIMDMVKSANGTYVIVDKRGGWAELDENCNILRNGLFNMVEGANMFSVGVDTEGNIVGGTEQGYIYVVDAEGKQIYSTRQVNAVAVNGFAFDGEKMYFTGYSDYVDTLDSAALAVAVTLQSLSSVIMIVLVASIVLAVFSFLLYFPVTYKAMIKFGKTLWKHKVAYIMIIPTFVLLALFNYTPMVIAVTRAFTNWSSKATTLADIEWVGFYNFQRMFTEGYFLIGIKNIAILAITGMIKTFTMPLIAAWLVYSLNTDRKKYIFRFLFVLPICVPGMVGTLMWGQIFNTGGGLDQILTAVGLEEYIHVWLGEEKTAIWSIVFMGIPYIGAFPFLMYYGGLSSIDNSLYEAARIDGANRWKIFWKIQLPMIAPQMKLLFMLQFIGCIQDYGGVYLLTGGGPGTSTYTPGLELYYNATRFGNYGYACAMGLVMFVFIMIGTLINNKIKAENYNS